MLRWSSALAILLLAAPASADGNDRARAERLFREGSELLEKGQNDEACTKLAESAALYRALGTEYNLGTCFELTHRTASAKRAYLRAAAIARQINKESIAKESYARARKMDSLIPKLVVKMPSETEGATVLCDGNPIVAGDVIELDPGPHLVKATAPGKGPFDARVELSESKTTEVFVSFTTAAPTPKPEEQAEKKKAPASEGGADPATLVGLVVGGAGVVVLGVGAYFAIHAKGEKDDSGCVDGRRCPDQASADRLAGAKSDANLATAFVVGGAVLATAGAVILFADPFEWRAHRKTSLTESRATSCARAILHGRLVPAIAPGYAALQLTTTF